MSEPVPPVTIAEEASPTRAQQLRDRAFDAFTDATDRVPILGDIVHAMRAEHNAGGGLLAGGIAYRVFFWLLPMAFASAIVANLLQVHRTGDLEQAADSRGLGGLVVAAQRQALASNGQEWSWHHLVAALLLAIWFGNGVVRALNVVFCIAWNQPVTRIRRPFVAGLAFTCFMTGIMGASGWVNSTLGELDFGTTFVILIRIASYSAAAYLVARLFPHRDAPARALLPGCLLMGAGSVGLFLVIELYLTPKVDTSIDLYGMLGAATVILLWLYLVARLVSWSAFLNSALWRAHQERHAATTSP